MPLTNQGGTSSAVIAASGGTASVAVDGERVEIMNPHATSTLWARWGQAPTVNGAGSFPIVPNGSYGGDGVVGTLYLLSTTVNQPFTCYKWS